MTPNDILHLVDQISRDLDMAVYKLELTPSEDRESLLKERDVLRKELERLRDNLEELARTLI